MYTLYYIARLYITVSGTGDKQKGFCRNGINSKASKDALNILRGFFTFKGCSFNRSFLCRLRVDKRMEQKNRLCDRLSNLNLDTRVKQRDQGLFSSCELISITKRLIVGEGQISTLIFYMKMILLGSRGKAVVTLK